MYYYYSTSTGARGRYICVGTGIDNRVPMHSPGYDTGLSTTSPPSPDSTRSCAAPLTARMAAEISLCREENSPGHSSFKMLQSQQVKYRQNILSCAPNLPIARTQQSFWLVQGVHLPEISVIERKIHLATAPPKIHLIQAVRITAESMKGTPIARP